MEGTPRPEPGAPQLRTLLLTDLCDSTQLVERLGDGMAAALFREHDRLVLELQQRWRGRLIDRSDGLLLVFERPLDGLGFALDYRQGLEALGRAHATGPLLARIGLHVGEVLMWQNSDEAVSAGAKSVEVEGLAKPFAARLMHLARPGQILLSAVAEPLVRRAARELGGRGHALQWRSHGRWRFKGVPEVQEVHEVGEPGLAPLRMPKGDAKAHRDIPLWRRPMALAAEVALVAGVAIGVWFITRPEPAIAFSERDWVVVADVRNLTGQAVLDDSLEQAFRMSLEQSRHVNVLSDLKVRDTLKRMRRQAETPIDRELASEIAIREGVWGVVLPAVAEVGGRVHVSLELVDPHTRQTLFSTSADGTGIDSVLASVDRVTSELRAALGEAKTSLARDSKPLPKVATQSLDALRAYALGQEAFSQGRYTQARDFYKRAIALDPEFALAYVGVTRACNVLDELPEGLPFLRRAQQLRENLPGRDQMYLDAWIVQVDDPGRAADAWMLVSEMYPDFFPALANTAYALEVQNQHVQASEFASRAAVMQSEFASLSFELLGRLRLAQEQRQEAWKAFEAAAERSLPSARVWQAIWHAVSEDFDAADKAWPADSLLNLTHFDRVSIYLDRGNWEGAVQEARRVEVRAREDDARYRQSQIPLAIALWAAGDIAAAKAQLQKAAELALVSVDVPTSVMDQRDDAVVALVAALLSQRIGDAQLAQRVSGTLKDKKHAGLVAMQPVKSLLVVLGARQELLNGEPFRAIAALEEVLDGGEPFQAHVALLEAHLMAGQMQDALREAKWIASRRGLAYSEYGCAWCQQGLNVVDARLARAHVKALSGKGVDAGVLHQRLALQSLSPAQVPAAHSGF